MGCPMIISIEYYAFALFIAALVCLVAIVYKLLFSNMKQQKLMLEEKETKLLQLYQTVEGIMDEFNDQVKASIEEIKEHESRAAKRMAAMTIPKEPVKTEQIEKVPRIERVDSTRIKAASDMLARAERIVKSDALKNPAVHSKSGNGAVFQRLLDDTAAEIPAPIVETPPQQTKNEAILLLAGEGKTDAQIASELGITQNEVKLVIGLTKKA